MSDPLSIAAGTAGFVSLGLEVVQSLISYYKAYSGRNQYVSSTLRKLENLTGILELLDDELSRRAISPAGEHVTHPRMIQTIESCSSQCLEAIHELKNELDKVKASTASTGRFRGALRPARVRIAYPFREETLKQIEASIDGLRSNLSVALDVLQVRDGQSVFEQLTRVIKSVAGIRQYQVEDDFKSWLNPPDVHSNHDRALNQHQEGTGAWLLDGLKFTRWLDRATSFLWLQGFAGRGKTVICSAAIERTISHSARMFSGSLGVAFYYFSFQEVSKQDAQGLLRALSFQLATQIKDGKSILKSTRDACKGVQPSQRESCDLLRKLVQRFTAVYFLWDAIDEVPAGRARDQLLKMLRVVRSWSNVHILITSRNLEDIRMQIDPHDHEELSMKSDGQDEDIQRYILSRLTDDPRLQRWHKSHGLIRSTLEKKAGGVFRWVECQLQLIARLPKSDSSLQSALESLPADLEETYERMLCDIDQRFAADAKRLLTILAFSCRELHDMNILDFLAIDLESSGGIDESRRFQGMDDLHLLCPGLIETGIQNSVHIAHFSVREYLTSSRIRGSKASYFALDSDAANCLLARIYLTYFKRHNYYSYLRENYWAYHYSKTVATREPLDTAILQLMESDPKNLAALTESVKLEHLELVELPNVDAEFLMPTNAEIFADLITASESAAFLTMHAVGCLLQVAYKYQREALFNQVLNTRFNIEKWHSHGVRTLLFHAVEAGLINWTKKLLELGADPNFAHSDTEVYIHGPSNPGATIIKNVLYPLHQAVRDMDLEMVQLLLANGADVNAVFSSHLSVEDGQSRKSDETGTALDIARSRSSVANAAETARQEAIVESLARAGGCRYEDLEGKSLAHRPKGSE